MIDGRRTATRRGEVGGGPRVLAVGAEDPHLALFRVRGGPRPGHQRRQEHPRRRAGGEAKRLWRRRKTTACGGGCRGSRNPPERGMSRAGGNPGRQAGADVNVVRNGEYSCYPVTRAARRGGPSMELSPSAHTATFCRDNLPPADQWPALRFDLGGLSY